MSEATDQDRQYIQQCLTLARQAAGQTTPNPMVGCVIVKDGQTIGQGFHPRAGQPHAEIFALRDAETQGHDVAGATAYVSLEPCNHQGLTPPCSQALIQAKIARCIIGMVDPNPQVSGSGIQTLRDAGISVTVGVEEAACQQLNEAFIHRMVHQQPFGIFKYAMTLDGKIATPSGHSQWITQPEARDRVHQLRATCDAIIVGGNTVRKDNPNLGTHGKANHNPLRVVMSRSLNLPKQAQLWDVNTTPTVVFTGRYHDPASIQHLRSRGVEVVILSELTPQSVNANLYDRGLSTILWECGGTLGAAAISQGCIQKLWAFVAPKLIGGPGYSPIGDLGIDHMDQALTLNRTHWENIGPDFLFQGYLTPNSINGTAGANRRSPPETSKT